MFGHIKLKLYQSQLIGKTYEINYSSKINSPFIIKTYLVTAQDIFYHFKYLDTIKIKDSKKMKEYVTFLEDDGYLPYNYYLSQDVSEISKSYTKKNTEL